MAAAHRKSAGKLAELERKVARHAGRIKSLLDAIRQAGSATPRGPVDRLPGAGPMADRGLAPPFPRRRNLHGPCLLAAQSFFARIKSAQRVPLTMALSRFADRPV
jgi:hypothetical protein